MIKHIIFAITMVVIVPGIAAQSENTVLREEIRKLDLAHAAAIFHRRRAGDCGIHPPAGRLGVNVERAHNLNLVQRGQTAARSAG